MEPPAAARRRGGTTWTPTRWLDDTPTTLKELLHDAIGASISAAIWRRVEGLLRVDDQ
jgi:hypothetical protein